MQVQNISGATHTFAFGRKTARTLADQETITIPDSPDAISDALTWRAAGLLDILAGPPTLLQSRTAPQHVLLAFGNVVDGVVINIGGEKFEFDDDDTVTSGNTLVDLGANAAAAAANLKTAINDDTVLAALGIVATDVLSIIAASQVYLIVVVASTVTLADLTATSSGGTVVVSKVSAVSPTAREVFTGVITAGASTGLLYTGLRLIHELFIQVRTSAGVVKAYDGKFYSAGGLLFYDAATGTADIASGDKIHVLALGEM